MNPMFNMMTQYQGIMNMARQMMQNPQQAVSQALPDLPDERRNDPNQIMNWLQQNGRINPQIVQTAGQIMRMMGGR